jgi:hypothetical protein
LLSPASRILIEELLRLSTLLGRAATPADVIAAVRGDPEHPLRNAFHDLTDPRDWPARLAWLVNRARLEQGLPDPEADLTPAEQGRRCQALAAAVAGLTDACAAHWPAILEADGEVLARLLISVLERARRQHA